MERGLVGSKTVILPETVRLDASPGQSAKSLSKSKSVLQSRFGGYAATSYSSQGETKSSREIPLVIFTRDLASGVMRLRSWSAYGSRS
jgi:hypothetical protein